jgi:hypothetical protein
VRAGVALFNALLISALSLLGVLATLYVDGITCSSETSFCASSTDKDSVYSGRLALSPDDDGALYRDQEFLVSFKSRQGEEPVAFRTDHEGRFCIRWAHESYYPNARTPDGRPLFVFGRPAPPLSELGLTSAPTPIVQRSLPCEEGDGGVPWYRAEDLTGSWQYKLLLAIPIAAFLVGALALLTRRREVSGWLYATGYGLLLIDILVWLAVGQ